MWTDSLRKPAVVHNSSHPVFLPETARQNIIMLAVSQQEASVFHLISPFSVTHKYNTVMTWDICRARLESEDLRQGLQREPRNHVSGRLPEHRHRTVRSRAVVRHQQACRTRHSGGRDADTLRQLRLLRRQAGRRPQLVRCRLRERDVAVSCNRHLSKSTG